MPSGNRRSPLAAIVADASFLADALLKPVPQASLRRLLMDGEPVHVLHLTDLEVASSLRRWTLWHDLDPGRAVAALDDYAWLPLQRHTHPDLLSRVFELRHNFTAYDAAYVALAERLDATLVTTDLRLRRAVERHAPRLLNRDFA